MEGNFSCIDDSKGESELRFKTKFISKDSIKISQKIDRFLEAIFFFACFNSSTNNSSLDAFLLES